jgi:BirA family biotin operon repressor/biotin-[acetyl-CoA-carboxylase] ligase
LTKSLGFPFIELRKVESTNNYAMGLIHAGMAQHGTTVFAHDQTMGKGQRDKQWLSAPNKNITLSLIVKPFGLKTKDLFLLSMCVANGVQRFLNIYAGEEIKIKWPNDIYWCDRKAGGILIENVIQGKNWKYAVIGIGLNINQTDFGDFKKAVSLKQITGNTYDIVEMAKELIKFLASSFQELADNINGIVHDYHQNLYKWNEKIHLKKDDQKIEAILKEVCVDGMLVVQHEKEEKFKVGEVEWLL